MNAKDGTLRKEQIYADARHPLKTAKDKNIDESQKDITRFIFSKNDILGKYDTICFTDGFKYFRTFRRYIRYAR